MAQPSLHKAFQINFYSDSGIYSFFELWLATSGMDSGSKALNFDRDFSMNAGQTLSTRNCCPQHTCFWSCPTKHLLVGINTQASATTHTSTPGNTHNSGLMETVAEHHAMVLLEGLLQVSWFFMRFFACAQVICCHSRIPSWASRSDLLSPPTAHEITNSLAPGCSLHHWFDASPCGLTLALMGSHLPQPTGSPVPCCCCWSS